MASLSTAVFVLVTTLLTAWAVGIGMRRILGQPVGRPRTYLLSLLLVSLGGSAVTSIASSMGLKNSEDFVDLGWGQILMLSSVWPWIFVVTLAVLLLLEVLFPTGSIAPPWMAVRSLREGMRNLRRYFHIIWILAKHGLLGFLGRGSGRRRARSFRNAELFRSLAVSLRSALTEAGVVYVKLGQMLATRIELFPPAFREELGKLHSGVQPMGETDVQSVLEHSYKRPVSEVFASFESTPLAAASIGQVHRARLHDGTQVVVKVQRRQARAQLVRDTSIIRSLARRMERDTVWGREMGVEELGRGFSDALMEELDFTHEAANTMLLRSEKQDADLLRIPKVYPALSNSNVLVMECLQGVALDAAASRLRNHTPERRRDLAAGLVAAVMDQVVLRGVFHADLHPGNIMLLDQGGLALLDFGSVGRLSRAERHGILALMMSTKTGNEVAAVQAMNELFGRSEQLTQIELERLVGRMLTKYQPSASFSAEIFADIFEIASVAGYRVPDQLGALFRTFIALQSSLEVLDPGHDLVASVTSHAPSLIAHLTNVRRLTDDVTSQALSLLPEAQRMPGRLASLLADLEAGQLKVAVQMGPDEVTSRTVGPVARLVVTALFGSLFLIAAVFLLATPGVAVAGGVPLNWLIASLTGLLGSVLAVRALFHVVHRSR